MDKETAIETALIVAFFTAILFLGPATAADHRLRHELPTGYGASDAYQHQTRAQAIYDMGQYRKEAPYMMKGFKDVIGFYPPVLPHATVLLARTSGLPVYDSLQLIVGLALALGALMVYYFVRTMSKMVALLSLPLTFFITTGAPFLGAVTFGQMPFALSSTFLITTAWAISRISLPKSWLLIAAALAGTIMTHTSEMLFFSIFIAAFFGILTAVRVVTEKEKLNSIKAVVRENKELIIALGIATAVTIYFWPLFIGIWLKMQPYTGISVETESASFPAATVHLWQFKLMYAAIIIGLIATIVLVVQKRKELGRLLYSPRLFPLIFSAYMMLVGYGTYLGFGLRSFQTRLYWPLTLAPLAGYGIYQIVKPVTAITGKRISPFIATAAIAILLSAFVVSAYYEKPAAASMPRQHWDAMRWIADNVPEDAKVWVMYSDVYTQTSMLYNDEHFNYFVERSDAADMINEINANNGTLNRDRRVSVAADTGAGTPYRKGLFSFGRHLGETSIFDMCSADYYLADLAFGERGAQLQQLNLFLIQKLVRSNMTVEYKNEWLVVLKNNDKGGECLAA